MTNSYDVIRDCNLKEVESIIFQYLNSISNIELKDNINDSLLKIVNEPLLSKIESSSTSICKRLSYFLCTISYKNSKHFIDNIYVKDNKIHVNAHVYENLLYSKSDKETRRVIKHLLTLTPNNNSFIITEDINDFFNIPLKESGNKINLNIHSYSTLPSRKTSKDLNREEMKLYQEITWDKRPIRWGNFDEMGGDCTNYASQVIFSGGASMISSGEYKWYYYNYNNRSPSWTGVNELSSFLLNNKSSGAHGEIYDTPFHLSIGDIIQFDLENKGENTHTAVIYDTHGYYNSIPTITSHSLDRFNEPIFVFKFYSLVPLHLYL